MPEEPEGTYDKGIYPEHVGHAVPDPMPIRDFEPWHLPRKQWIRREQWKRCARRLLGQLSLTDRPLRYLGLPGTELLDLEVLAELCTERNVGLRYLGFNTGSQSPGQQTTQRLSENLLQSVPGVEGMSVVTADDLLALASKTSLAYGRLGDVESFDLVNLDLCDVFTSKQGRPVHAAVKNIVEYQLNKRTQPWLMFVTTAIDRDAIADEDVVQYRRQFDANAAQWSEFGERISQLAAESPASTTASASAVFTGANGMLFGKLLAVSIGKWLASLLKQPQPWKVELKSCVCYRRGLGNMSAAEIEVPEPELFSLVFQIQRYTQTLTDPSGLGEIEANPPISVDWGQAEKSMALQMVRKAARALDLDIYLQDKPDDYLILVEQSASQLQLRNFDPEKYRIFATSIPRIPTRR
jgi:hypothetical protein